MAIYVQTRSTLSNLFRSPDRDRLAGAIAEAWVDFDRQLQQHGPASITETWSRAAYRLLIQADRYLVDSNLQQGWVALQSAQRAMLANPADSDKIARVAIVLRREAEKVSGWRSDAIKDLICGPQGELLTSLTAQPERVLDALGLRDDQFNTTYFKILLRRRHLFHLFLLLFLSLLICLLLSILGQLPEPFADPKLVAAVLLFGALGAGVSVSQGLLAPEISAKIPAQQIGAFVVWMRPAIGATAALMALVILNANDAFKFFAWKTTHPGVIIAIAFVAGYSERFIVGAVERISNAVDKK